MVNALAGLAAGIDASRNLQSTYDNSRLNMLAGQAYTAPQEQRQSLLGQMASINPQAAQAQQSQWQGDEDRQTKLLVNGARYMKGAIDSKNPNAVAGAWNSLRPAIIRAGLATEQELSPTWDPSYETTMHQLLGMGGPEVGASSQNKVVGGALVTPAGEVVYEAPVDTQLVELSVPGGKQKFIYNPRTQEVSPLNSAMRQMMQDGEQYRVGGDLTPEQLALAQADMASGGASDSYNLGQRSVSPQQLASGGQLGFTPDKPEISAAEQMRLDMAREAGARADRAEARADRSEQRQVAANSVSGRTPNEGERNASGFYQRMVAANAELKRLTDAGYDPTNLRDHLTVGSAVGNYLASNEGQQYNQAAMNWVRANLRKESGAAIGVDEARQEIRNYFPQPGDSPEVVRQKASNRFVVEQAMLQAAGRAAPQQAVQRQVAPDRQQSNAIPQRARNPQTGQVIELRNGQWVPVQ